MNITEQDVEAVYDVARQDRLAGRHEAKHAAARWAQRTDSQQLVYNSIFYDGPSGWIPATEASVRCR